MTEAERIIRTTPTPELVRGLRVSRQYVARLRSGERPISGSVMAKLRAWLGEGYDIDADLRGDDCAPDGSACVSFVDTGPEVEHTGPMNTNQDARSARDIIDAEPAGRLSEATGYTRAYIYHLKAGHRPVTRAVIMRLVEAFGDRVDVAASLRERKEVG
jgi:plasmid maintenance system antidote protein VapI